jgi:uncharacterized protein CbrC (UPF0167 family)
LPATFRHFRDPHRFAAYSAEPQACDLCGQERPGYSSGFCGEADLDFVCEPCLQAGRLAEQGCFTVDPNLRELESQLRTGFPDWDEVKVKAVAKERTDELMVRTPKPLTWQDFLWPAHCGDYCCYIGEVGKPDLKALAPSGDGRAFLTAHLHPDEAGTDVADLWNSVRPNSPMTHPEAYSVGVYLFQCLHCGQYVIHWDCD